ncbi:MAG: MFS transporter [Vicinamibacterales bacterium]
MAGVSDPSFEVRRGANLGFMLRAFKYRNYRLFFGGQLVSLIGTWITTTATSWLVYRLTGNAWYLGVVGFASQFPAFLLSSAAGIFVDRWDRHRLLLATQTASMCIAFLLAALTLSGLITIEALIAISVLQGLVNAFDMPCRQAFVASVIEDKADLGNAIALNSSMFNGARLVGPSVAAAVIAATNEGWCFLLDGISFFAVLLALLAMRVDPRSVSARPHAGLVHLFKEGWSYVFGFAPVRAIITLLAVSSLVGVPYTVLMPVFAGDVLHGGPETFGFLMTAAGFGALLGAVWLASRTSVVHLSRMIPIAAGLFGSGLIGLSLTRQLWLSLLCMVCTGFGVMVQAASSNTVLQTVVPDDKRGRVMSFFLMAYLGMAPLGSLIAGALSGRIGVPMTLLVGGGACLAGALWFAGGLPSFHATLRPVYEELGVIPAAQAHSSSPARPPRTSTGRHAD